MARNNVLTILAGAVSLALGACAQTVELEFVDHVKAGMIEQDVYVEKSPGEGQVYRIEAEEFDAFKNAPLYATTRVVHHAPFSPQHNGPYPKGRELGMTMAEWLSGTGKATYTCKAGTGTIDSAFTNLVPNGLYTMWHALPREGHRETRGDVGDRLPQRRQDLWPRSGTLRHRLARATLHRPAAKVAGPRLGLPAAG